MAFHVPEKFRVTSGKMGSSESFGNNGCFVIQTIKLKQRLNVIASDQGGWEHVSVSLGHRSPTWEEMCAIKDMFWDAEDCVVQYHPPKSEYVNHHPYCLHLWRPVGINFPQPPSIFVGPR